MSTNIPPQTHISWRPIAVLALLASIMGVAIAAIVNVTEASIADQRLQARMAQLTELIPAHSYNNALHRDVLTVNAPGQFQSEAPVLVYRARQDSRVVSLIFALTAHNGYNGDIDLLVAINTDGNLQAVRVVRHQETPGLGDGIELRKSDWILQFSNLPTTTLNHQDWQLRKYGGQFQQLTGATISATAVLTAVERALEYYHSHREQLLTSPINLSAS